MYVVDMNGNVKLRGIRTGRAEDVKAHAIPQATQTLEKVQRAKHHDQHNEHMSVEGDATGNQQGSELEDALPERYQIRTKLRLTEK